MLDFAKKWFWPVTLTILFLIAGLFVAGMPRNSGLPILSKMGGDFTLPSSTGKNVSLSQFRGKPVLLTFGFTSCPDVCPGVLARMRSAIETLPDHGKETQVLFVSFDPQRDTVTVLRDYLAWFDPAFIGLTGSEKQIADVTHLYKVVYMPDASPAGDSLMYTHSDYIYLLDQQGRVRRLYGNDDLPSQITQDIYLLLQEQWRTPGFLSVFTGHKPFSGHKQ